MSGFGFILSQKVCFPMLMFSCSHFSFFRCRFSIVSIGAAHSVAVRALSPTQCVLLSRSVRQRSSLSPLYSLHWFERQKILSVVGAPVRHMWTGPRNRIRTGATAKQWAPLSGALHSRSGSHRVHISFSCLPAFNLDLAPIFWYLVWCSLSTT